MIAHLFKLIWNQRKANGLILVELFLIFILLWVCNYQLSVYIKRLSEPLGFDVKHVYKISLADYPENHPARLEGQNYVEDFFTLYDRIRTCPGVEVVSISAYILPFAGYSNYGRIYADTLMAGGRQGSISPEFIDVFRLKPNNPDIDLKKELTENRGLMTIDMWEKLFPEGTTDYTVYWNDNKDQPVRTRGVLAPLKRSEYQDPYPFMFDYLSRSEAIERGWIGGNDEIAVRVSPEADKDFPRQFKELMKGQLRSGNLYVTDVVPLESMKRRYYAQDSEKDTFYQSLLILGFFIINIFLGVIGTFWLRTEGRKEEMGLRMAVGSSRNGLKGIMIMEALLLLAIVWIPAVLVCINLGYSDLLASVLNLEFVWKTGFISLAVTTLLMAVMIILGVLYPAQESASIEPAEALRYE